MFCWLLLYLDFWVFGCWFFVGLTYVIYCVYVYLFTGGLLFGCLIFVLIVVYVVFNIGVWFVLLYIWVWLTGYRRVDWFGLNELLFCLFVLIVVLCCFVDLLLRLICFALAGLLFVMLFVRLRLLFMLVLYWLFCCLLMVGLFAWCMLNVFALRLFDCFSCLLLFGWLLSLLVLLEMCFIYYLVCGICLCLILVLVWLLLKLCVCLFVCGCALYVICGFLLDNSVVDMLMRHWDIDCLFNLLNVGEFVSCCFTLC